MSSLDQMESRTDVVTVSPTANAASLILNFAGILTQAAAVPIWRLMWDSLAPWNVLPNPIYCISVSAITATAVCSFSQALLIVQSAKAFALSIGL